MELTEHEKAAIKIAKGKCGNSYDVSPERHPEPGYIYDFADPDTRTFGQCWMKDSGEWSQAPVGTNPVVLSSVRRQRG